MFEFNKKKELAKDNLKENIENGMGFDLLGNASFAVITGIGVPKVSQAGRVGRNDQEFGWTSSGVYRTRDWLEVPANTYMRNGLPAIGVITTSSKNGPGGFVSHSSPTRRLDRVLDGLYLNKDAKEITLPPSVKYIKDHIFKRFKNLERIVIPGDAIEISNLAFADCPKLKKIDILNSVNKIELDAFVGCRSLTSINIGGDVSSIAIYAINRCRNLTSINIAGNVGKILGCAIQYCDNLTSINIGGNVNRINPKAISDCERLVSIIVGGRVGKMFNNSFKDCPNLRQITTNANKNHQL